MREQQQAGDHPQSHWEDNFRRRLVELRERLGYTQAGLARRLREDFGLRFHPQTVQRLESGDRPVRLNEAHVIALALGVGLSSMTESNSSSDYASLRLEVDRIRSGAHLTGVQAMRKMDAFVAEYVAGFADQMAYRILGASTAERGNVNEVAEWGLAWAEKVITAYDWASAASESLHSLAYGDTKPDTGGASLHRRAQAVIETLRSMTNEYERRGLDLDELAAKDPDRLYMEIAHLDPELTFEQSPEEATGGAR